MWPPNEASPAAKPTSRPLLVTLNIKRVVDAIERAVATPQDQIVMHRAFGRQVLGQRAPLAARAQDIHDPIHHFANVDRALVAARLGRRDQPRDVRPLGVGQITRISQLAAVVSFAVLCRPHR